jgi:hypothetical protein
MALNTVKRHANNIDAKLQVENRAQVVSKARRLALDFVKLPSQENNTFIALLIHDDTAPRTYPLSQNLTITQNQGARDIKNNVFQKSTSFYAMIGDYRCRRENCHVCNPTNSIRPTLQAC